MGISMPKFISERYTRMKESYNDLKDSFQMVRSMWKLVKGIDTSKFADTQNTDDLVGALNNVDGLPDAYKKILSTVDPELLKKMTKMMYESFSKKGTTDENEKRTPEYNDIQEDKQLKDFDPANTTVEINPDAIRKVGEAILGGGNPFGKMFEQMNNNRHGPTPNMKPKVLDETQTVNDSATSEASKSWHDKEKESYKTVFEKTKSENDRFKASVNEARRMHQQRQSPQEASMSGQPDPQGYNMYKHMNVQNKEKLDKGFTPFGFPGEKSKSSELKKKEIPPLTKMLGEELDKKFGPDWKKKVPSFVRNPNMSPNIPDLGLGLDKESNQNMAKQMSKVLQDLL